jgi:gamma-glutamyltranspeptidase/glutathione hydrolase
VKRFLAIALFCAAACSAPSFHEQVDWPPPKRGMVVSEHPLATRAGVRILEIGGNAADAAVATALTLAVVYPQAGNLGGGGFALWVPHGETPTSLDFRETAPGGSRPEYYLDATGTPVAARSLASPLAVGTPGSPAGLYELFHRFGSGRVSWSEVCRDAIRLAEDGFPVDAWLAHDLVDPGPRARLEADSTARALFYPGGEALGEGAMLLQPELASTLRTLSARGPEGFYRGEIASAMIAALAAVAERSTDVPAGSTLSLVDLEGYTVREREPLVGWFRGAQVISMGPPSSGGVALLQVLAILEGFPLDAARTAAKEEENAATESPRDSASLSPLALHWWIEAMRRAFADRAEHLGDADFVTVPTSELLAPEWIARRRVSIGMHADLEVGPWTKTPAKESDATTHLSVIDRKGNAVSLTTTLNATFGSGILVPGAGFLLNDEIDDFAMAPGKPNLYGLVGGAANALAPKKRPLSSMTPTVVREGGRRVTLVIGAPGGPRIITAVTQVLLRVLVYGQTLDEAVRAPRLHQQWKPETTLFEGGWDPALLAALQRDHAQPIEVQPDGTFGSVQAIWIGPDGEPVGASDPRRGGTAQAEKHEASVPARPDDRRR